jgi:hypothetical protein
LVNYRQKTNFGLFVQAYQLWRDMTKGTPSDPKSDSDIFEAEVKDIPHISFKLI